MPKTDAEFEQELLEMELDDLLDQIDYLSMSHFLIKDHKMMIAKAKAIIQFLKDLKLDGKTGE